MEVWGFLWIMFALKIPLAALLFLVWWAIHDAPDPEESDGGDDGGIGKPRERPPLPHDPRRRGPHGDPVVPPPPRVRTTARSSDRAAR